jgi:hypothetical protein
VDVPAPTVNSTRQIPEQIDLGRGRTLRKVFAAPASPYVRRVVYEVSGASGRSGTAFCEVEGTGLPGNGGAIDPGEIVNAE